MRFTDKELELMFTELSAVNEFSEEEVSGHPEPDNERHNLLESVLDKIADEQIRRETRKAVTQARKAISKWDRFRNVSAMDLLMDKINKDRSASQ